MQKPRSQKSRDTVPLNGDRTLRVKMYTAAGHILGGAGGPRAQVIHFRCVYTVPIFSNLLCCSHLDFYTFMLGNITWTPGAGEGWGQCRRKWTRSRKQMKSRLCTFWNSWFFYQHLGLMSVLKEREVIIYAYVGCIGRVQIWWGSVAFAVRVAVALLCSWWGVELHYLSHLF